MTNEPHTNVSKLSEYLNDCEILELAEFEQIHGRVFLLHHGAIGSLRKPVDDESTLKMESDADNPDRPSSPRADFLVFPIKPQEDELIWIGRSPDNDVVIPDATISEVHAFVKFEDNECYIQDTGSRNGTYVNGERVPQQGIGDAVRIVSNSRVQFGSVGLTVLFGQQFRSMVTQILG